MQPQQHIDRLKAEKLKKLEDSEFKGMIDTLKNQLSDPAHLIPELLQNAEDAGASHVRIQLDENRLLFQHDGDKFEDEHVTAICGMCQSTKRSSLEYIGTFGVGFKSTFAVTKNPEIHSGAYSFRFDEETVIVPHWIEREDKYGDWDVTIVLPLKDRYSYESALKQLEAFEVTSAKPMIFLRKLKEVSIQRNGTAASFEISGIEIAGLNKLGENFKFVELKKNGAGGKRFCVYTLPEVIPSHLLEHVQIKRRLRLTEEYKYETNVKVAFEVGSDGHIIASKDGRLNAFLPTRIRTFVNFDVNAGFLLSPDRENLESVEDRYNCWLLRCGIKAFKSIIESYKEKASSEFWPDIYKLFPLQEDIREEWIEGELCTPIKEYFKSGTLFLVSDVNNPWRRLHEVIDALKEIRLLFPIFSELDHKSGELGQGAYLSDTIDADSREALVKEFKLPRIDEDFLIDSLSNRDLLKNRDVDWLLSLFALLGKKYSTLYSYSWDTSWKQKEFLNKVRQCYLIPCENGSNVKLSQCAMVYRSISALPDFICDKVVELRQDLHKALNQDIKEDVPRERQQNAREFLWALTREATPENLYNYLIKQEFEKVGEDELSEQECETLDNYTLFLKDKNVAKSDIKLRVKEKREYRGAESLYLANSFLTDSNGLPFYNIEKLLLNCDDVLFVNPHYLGLGIDSKDTDRAAEWREFLVKCGVKDFPALKDTPVFDAKSREEFERKFQKRYHRQPPQLEGSDKPYTGNDSKYKDEFGYNKMAYRLMDRDFSDNFKNIINSRLEDQDRDFFFEFLKMLDYKWGILKEHMYLFYFHTVVAGKQEIKKTVLHTPSSLSEWLQKRKWLPARLLPEGGMELNLPSEVYLFTPETEGIKGGFYIEPDNIKSIELRKLLGLRTARAKQEPVSIREEPIDDILEKYGKLVADNTPLDKDMEKFIKKMYLRLNDAMKDDINSIWPNFKTYLMRVYDASRNLNDLSEVHYCVSNIDIINDLYDDVKREVLFLPGTLNPWSIKNLLAAMDKRDLLAGISRELPENIRSREEETSYFRDLANALWSFLRDEKDNEGEELKAICKKIAGIRAHSVQNLCYRLLRETEPISNWIETDGILYKDVFWFSGDLRDLSVGVAEEICMRFGFEKYIRDFIKEVFSRSINSVKKSLKDHGREYEVIIKEPAKTFLEKIITPREKTETPVIDTNKDVPIEETEPQKAEIGFFESIIGGGVSRSHSTQQERTVRDQHRHTREETGRRGEEVMEKKILPEIFQGGSIKYVDKPEYDFIVESADGSVIYIEVKSSASDENEFTFEMSEAQKRFAEEQGENYQLWFLTNIWDEKPSYVGPCNYNELLESGMRMVAMQETIYKCTVAVAHISDID